MSYVIAVAGKGGTGKTTIAALIIRTLKENNSGSVLAVDADPNNNLGESLGVKIDETVGMAIDDIATHPEKIPAGLPKERFIEYRVQTLIKECEGFDLLTMGRPEGPGCYCYANNLLRDIVARLIREYDYIVIDNEAGLEHFSRRTTRQADALIVVSDDTKVGLKSAARIRDLVEELKLKIKNKFLLINRAKEIADDEDFKHLNLEYIGLIPEDENITQIGIKGGTLFDLGKNSNSLKILGKIGEKVWKKN